MRNDFSTEFVKDMGPDLAEHYLRWLPFCRESIQAVLEEQVGEEALRRTWNSESRGLSSELLKDGLVTPFRSYLHRSGKMLRPYLVCWCLEAYGINPTTRPRQVGLAEIIHSTSLILDDIVDDSPFRRGDLTAHRMVGMLIAGAAGGGWLNMGFDIAEQDRALLGSYATDRLIQELAWEHFVTGLGTTVDLVWAWKASLNHSAAEYLQQVVHRSTSYTYRLPMKIGGLSAGAPEPEVAKLAAFGEQIGLAFQLIDDLLNVKPVDAHWGKQVAEDIGQGKITLQVLVALRQADPLARARLVALLQERTNDPVKLREAVEILGSTGALEECRALASRLYEDAARIVDSMEVDEKSRRRLHQFAAYIVQRGR